MGKSAKSCFKIITCGDDSTDNDDLAPTESKASSNKSKWSFWKRSASHHRVVSNTVTSGVLSAGNNKESSVATTNEFHLPTNSSFPEKTSILEWTDEKPSVSSAIVDLETANTTSVSTATTDYRFQESVAVVIQATIRGYLGQRELQKRKNVVKLQAAVRGHLVRRQAVGTLRCIHAIVKMQALVRARHARQSMEKSAVQEKLQIYTHRSTFMSNENYGTKLTKTYSSTKRLLSNGFARQLLESTPKTKPIHISCDPSKPDSAWKWLERWMAMTSSDIGQQQELNLNQSYQEQEGNTKLVAYEAAISTEGGDGSMINNPGGFEFQAPVSVPNKYSRFLVKDDRELSQLENEALVTTMEDHTNTRRILGEISDSISSQTPPLSNTSSQSLVDCISDKPELDRENPKYTRREACEPLEAEGKKLALGSRKACNTAFAAAHSKFEELSSTATGHRSISSACKDVAAESRSDTLPSLVDSATKTEDFSLTENSISHDPRVQIAASECGTEISISSTLDSPDRSESGGEIVLEIGALDKEHYNVNSGTGNAFTHGNMNAEAKKPSSDSKVHHSERLEESERNPANLIALVDPVRVDQQPVETTTSDMQIQLGNLPQVYRSSPEGSPRSHITAPESHGTPSSQISTNAKKSKVENNITARKQRSQLIGKKSPSNPNHSPARTSTDQLPKDPKNAKRRNSFGLAKPDHIDHEPRVSSINSLPSYMQATESAKAKALLNISPKASPDGHDKDNYLKKRHSLPMGNGKQSSSPRMQRSTSQVQASSKGNDIHSPHNSAERKWQR